MAKGNMQQGQGQPMMGGMRPPNMPPMGRPNPGIGVGPAEQGIAAPPPGIIEMLMQMMQGKNDNFANGALGKIQGGINRLKGPNQKPEMNKNPPRMPVPQAKPQSQMMMPPQMMGGGMRQFGGGSGEPTMQPPPMMGGGMPMQQPQFNPQLLAMFQQGGGRNFV